MEKGFSVVDLLQTKEFKDYIQEVIIGPRLKRGDAPTGKRYLRTPLDYFIDRGEFDVIHIKNACYSVLMKDKTAGIPRTVRDVLEGIIFSGCRYVLQIKKNKDGKEESRVESSNS